MLAFLDTKFNDSAKFALQFPHRCRDHYSVCTQISRELGQPWQLNGVGVIVNTNVLCRKA